MNPILHRLPRWGAALSLVVALFAMPGLALAAVKVLFITASPVSPGKFVALAKAAEPLGLHIEARYAEKLAPDLDASFWKGADLVLIDAPRQHIEDEVRLRLGAALPALAAKPHIWLPTAAPKAGGAVSEAFAKRLHAYYVNGGRANMQHFLQALQSQLAGKSENKADWAQLPEPIVFPPAALYHPKLPQIVLPTPAAYLQWRGIDAAVDAKQRPPVVGIAFHQQSISAEQTGFIDDLIRRIEAGGAVAWPFYSPVLDADSIRRMVMVDGKPMVDVLINTQITLSPEARRNEFQAMGIPVIQAMAYRRGDAAAWAADPQGVQLMDVPFYLAQAEYAGITDIQIAAATRKGDEQVEPIAAQSAAVVGKALNLLKLQRKSADERKVAMFFWNYPAGEKNLSASFMNLPKSFVATLASLQAAGYRTEVQEEKPLTLLLQRLLKPAYEPPENQAVLRDLLRDGLAGRLPLADYKRWLAALPAEVQAQLRTSWGEPEQSSMLLSQGDERFFVIPRLQLGHITLLPQPSRGERGGDKERALYHSNSATPSHFYLATYLWARQVFGADALVHYGTHGSQEWLPGKERGLSASHDYPMLAVGDVPVLYPYIVDNIGEATQARRRGRATIISHQTPPFAPAGLHDALTHIHDTLHLWLAQEEGGVKEKLKAEFLTAARKERIPQDLGWSEARIAAEFPRFLNEVHDHLHELARTAQPLGLHTFGEGPEDHLRVATVLLMLGHEFWEGMAGPGEEADEMLVGDWKKLADSSPFRKLQALLKGDDSAFDSAKLPEATRAKVAKAREWYAALDGQSESAALLAGLEGRYIPTSYGGDPIKNPDALPTGRNLYGFDPSRVPTQAAWEAGKEAMDKLIAAHQAKTGQPPKKLTFTLWSVETMRHFGLLEAQALWAMGVEPVWDAGGRVSDVKLIPRGQLGRPRVDIVLSATGLYRDHFPNVMRQLAKAAKLAAEAEEADNPVAANARRIAQRLQARGVDAAAAVRAGQTRIFSSETGRYGTGLDDAALATDTWKTQAEGDRKLAELYLSRMQFAYGPDEAEWGAKGVGGSGGGKAGQASAVNLYAEHLRGTEGAVLARSSNLYGMLTTDDPFQYLGGIALAVRQLDGKAPELYISNLRGTGAGGGAKVEGAAQFLAKELATRNFHPGYIEGLMKEGYAGTLQVLDGVNNFAGWQSVAREIVRDDQWQEFMDVYVRDKHNLGLKRWFESQNPHALAQSIERMLEAARQGQWKADAQSVAELKARWRELAQRFDVKSDNQAFNQFVGAPGFGLDSAAAAAMAKAAAAPKTQPAAAAAATPPPVAPPPPPIQGMKLDKVQPPAADAAQRVLGSLAVLFLLLLASAGGGWRAWRQDVQQQRVVLALQP